MKLTFRYQRDVLGIGFDIIIDHYQTEGPEIRAIDKRNTMDVQVNTETDSLEEQAIIVATNLINILINQGETE